MRLSVWALIAVLSGCATSIAAPLSLTLTGVGGVDATQPIDQQLATVEDHEVVLLDASMPLTDGRSVSAVNRRGVRIAIDACDFGPLRHVAEVDLPVADNHLLATVRIGRDEDHAANAAFCEYSTLGDGPHAQLRVRGCFIALSFSVPTARWLVFNPAPASACDLL